MKPESSTGYWALLKTHGSFRNLWYGQIVSELGDWLNSIAIFTLILQLGGSGTALATVMMAKLLPIFFVSPVAGVLIDRMNRKTILIVSDGARFFIVLGFLFISDRGDLWMVYALTVLEISMAGFFEPARSAIIPSLIPKKDLVTANALSGATWSVMLALGAALGGVVVSLWGLRTAFIIDSLTFLISAWFICRIRMEDKPMGRTDELSKKSGVDNFLEGVRYIFTRPLIFMLTFLKSGLAVVGGVMTLIPLYANQLSLHPASVAMATGIMYSCRGIGAALGPLLVKGIFGGTTRTLQFSIAIGFFLGSLSLLLFGYSGNIGTASFSLALIGMCGAVIWVFSTTLIHMEADNRYLGRVFSMEMGSLTLIMGMSNWGVGVVVDKIGLTPNEAAQALAGWFMIPGIIWTLFILLTPNPVPKEQPLGIVPPVDPSGCTPPPIDRQQKG